MFRIIETDLFHYAYLRAIFLSCYKPKYKHNKRLPFLFVDNRKAIKIKIIFMSIAIALLWATESHKDIHLKFKSIEYKKISCFCIKPTKHE